MLHSAGGGKVESVLSRKKTRKRRLMTSTEDQVLCPLQLRIVL